MKSYIMRGERWKIIKMIEMIRANRKRKEKGWTANAMIFDDDCCSDGMEVFLDLAFCQFYDWIRRQFNEMKCPDAIICWF